PSPHSLISLHTSLTHPTPHSFPTRRSSDLNPNPMPKTQKRIPISSNRWPSIPRKLTCDRSGSFRFASPPTSEEDWPKAHVVRAMTAATAPATIFPIRHPWDATLASQMRIGIPPDENLSDVHEFKSHIPVHSMTKRSLPERQGAHCRSSEHASTARLEKDC